MSANNCKQPAGVIAPQIDRNRCEGKADCVVVCPVNVFSVQTLPKAEREGLSLRGKLKGFVHGWQQAMLLNPHACEACGLCVQACPEKAIRLIRTEKNNDMQSGLFAAVNSDNNNTGDR